MEIEEERIAAEKELRFRIKKGWAISPRIGEVLIEELDRLRAEIAVAHSELDFRETHIKEIDAEVTDLGVRCSIQADQIADMEDKLARAIDELEAINRFARAELEQLKAEIPEDK